MLTAARDAFMCFNVCEKLSIRNNVFSVTDAHKTSATAKTTTATSPKTTTKQGEDKQTSLCLILFSMLPGDVFTRFRVQLNRFKSDYQINATKHRF